MGVLSYFLARMGFNNVLKEDFGYVEQSLKKTLLRGSYVGGCELIYLSRLMTHQDP